MTCVAIPSLVSGLLKSQVSLYKGHPFPLTVALLLLPQAGGNGWGGRDVLIDFPAVDKKGHTIDFLLTPTRDRDAAEACLRKALRAQGLLEKITIDKSGSNTAAIQHYNQTHKAAIVIRHSKYLNNLVEQDHRAVKRRTRPMLGFTSFWAARCTIAGGEVRHAIRKGQAITSGQLLQTPAARFYALAA